MAETGGKRGLVKKTDRASSLCSSTTTLGWTPRWTCPRDCMLAELKVLVRPGMAVQRLNPVNYGVPKLGWRRPTREKGIRWDVVVFFLKMIVVLFLYSFNSIIGTENVCFFLYSVYL